MLSALQDEPMPRKRRRRLAQIGQRLALQRWQQQQCNPLVFRRKHNELYGDTPSYSNCIFLNEHDIVLAYSTAGDVDVLRLPTVAKGQAQQLASSLALQQQLPRRSLAPHNKARLHSIENGESFAVGRSSGKFDVFTTEHVSSWQQQQYATHEASISQGLLPSTFIQRGYRFDCLLHEPSSAHHASYQHLLMPPRSTYQEMVETPTLALIQQQQPQQQDPVCLEFQQQSLQLQRDMCPPAPDALWDFQDRPSHLLALHVLASGCTLRVMDTRLPETSSVFSIDIHSNVVVETVTASCFASSNTVVTAHNAGLNQLPDTFLKTWDIRQPAAPLTEDRVSLPQGSFIQYVSFSKQKATLMLSLAHSQNNHNGNNNHFIWDLGLRSTVARYSLPPSSVFAVTPNHDTMVCSHQSPKPDFASASSNLLLFDLSTAKRRHSATSATSKIPSTKRTRGQHEAASILATMQPVLQDRYGLCTELACLALNPTGTSLIGGSADGDIFAWRGSDLSNS